MFYLRWAATIIAFPIGGLVASLVVGKAHSLPAAVGAALIAGAIIGLAQWLALAKSASWRWAATTTLGFAIGAAASYALFAGSIAFTDIALTGLVTGASLGAGQGLALRRGWRVTLLWATTVACSWGIGWVISVLVIAGNASGYIVFGLSGAAVVTVITGVVLKSILSRDHEPRGAATAPRSLEVVR